MRDEKMVTIAIPIKRGLKAIISVVFQLSHTLLQLLSRLKGD